MLSTPPLNESSPVSSPLNTSPLSEAPLASPPNRQWLDWTFLCVGLLTQIITFFVANDLSSILNLKFEILNHKYELLSLISGCLGICSVCLTAQGRLVAFVFGFAQVFTYTAICLRANLYGEVAINIYYFITMIYGVYLWKRRMQPQTNRLITRRLSWSHWGLMIILILLLSAGVGYARSRFSDDPTPYMDAFTTVAAIAAQLLMIFAYRDQWFLWMAVDIVAIVMWCVVGDYCMVAQYAFWCANCLYGYLRWTQLSKP